MSAPGSMAAAKRDPNGSLLAAALGVAVLAAGPPAMAQARSVQSRSDAPPQEVVVTASRQWDAALTAKVIKVLQDDPYVFADHISIETEDGIVRLRGIVLDRSDLSRTLTLARRVAGRRRVVNELELLPPDADHD